jgi:hypothetical protein
MWLVSQCLQRVPIYTSRQGLLHKKNSIRVNTSFLPQTTSGAQRHRIPPSKCSSQGPDHGPGTRFRGIIQCLGFSQRLDASCRVTNASAIVSDVPLPPTFQTEERRADVTPEQLADSWMIGIETARQTLKQTVAETN